jgi:hypothetical protein
MLLSKESNVPEDFLAAIDLGLLEGHLFVEVAMEGGRGNVAADLSDPFL